MKYETTDKVVKGFLCGAVAFASFAWGTIAAHWLYHDVYGAEAFEPVTYNPGPKLLPQTFPEFVKQQTVRFSADDVLNHVTLINKGSDVPIYFVDVPEIFCWFVNFPPSYEGRLYGIFSPEWRDGRPRIVIWGRYTTEVGVFAHEFVHYLESEIPHAREEIRIAFQKLFAEDFRIGYTDLIGPAEPNTVKGEATLDDADTSDNSACNHE